VSSPLRLGILAMSGLAGCAAAPHSRASGAVTPLAVRPVDYNPTGVPLGHVRAVADAGDLVAVFADTGATVLSSGALAGADRSGTDWIDAGTIRGADGAARWMIGIDHNGRLQYVRGPGAVEDVSGRFGLEGQRVRGAAMLDSARVGFLLDQEIAVADGRRVTRYGTAAYTALVGGGGWAAGVGGGRVVLIDPRKLATRTYVLPGVTYAALGPDGRLYAATTRAVYASSAEGDLELVYDADRASIHGLVMSGDRAWFADGTELGVVDRDRVAETKGAEVAPDARLAASASGDVWVIAHGGLRRFARADPEPAQDGTWSRTIAPVFARSCSSCHLPNGVSGTDLSTSEAWHSERRAIHERVVVSKTMPPEGHPLSEADRAAIRSWSEEALRAHPDESPGTITESSRRSR
jgi:mono/diheme cytochrome c family protein